MSDPRRLVLCYGCRQFVWPRDVRCPFCGANVRMLWYNHQRRMQDGLNVANEIAALLAQIQSK